MSFAVPSPRAFLALVVSLLLALSLVGTLPSPVRAATVLVTTTTDELDTLPATGTGCSLREAVVAANTNAAVGGCPAGELAAVADDLISIPAGTYNLSIAGGNEDAAATGDLDILEYVEIVGAGAFSTVIDSGLPPPGSPAALDRIFHLVSADASISDVMIIGGSGFFSVEDAGGGIFVAGGLNLELIDSLVGFSGADVGAGIFLDELATLDMSGTTVIGNVAGLGDGGGIYVANNATATISDSTIGPSNSAGDEGGGIYVDGMATLTDSVVTENEANASGGGIHIGFGTASLDNSTVSENGADNGGGIANESTDTLILNGSLVSGNAAESDGGGIWNASGATASITDTVIESNAAGAAPESLGNGGGICCGGVVTIVSSSILENSATASGGGIHHESGSLSVSGSMVSGNSAFSGGGVATAAETEITTSTVGDNFADGQGGGILSTGPLTLLRSTLSENTAFEGGGMTFVSGVGSPVTIENSTVSGNSGGDGAGGILAIVESGGSAAVKLVTVTDNASVQGGITAVVAVTGSLVMSHSIVAVNDPGDCNTTGTVTSGGANIGGDDTCPFTNAALGDLNDTDPLLGPLADNGGPTETHALLAGSPAIDRGLAACGATTDQRGMPRPTDGDGNGIARCDSGAYEAAAKAPPEASINDVSVTEGNSGTVDAVFTVTLSAASLGTVTMAYATADDTATAPADYEAAAGTVTFAPGDVSETITVNVVGDTLDEPNETFFVNLTAPVGATLADAQGTGTILDDDGAPAPVTPTPSPTPTQQVLADTTVAPPRSSEAWLGFAMALLLLTGVFLSALGFNRRAAAGRR